MQPQLHIPGRLHSLLQISKCFASALFAIPFFQYSQHRGSIAHLPRVWPKSQVYQHLTPIFIPKTAGCVNNDHTCCMKLTCSVAASFFPLPCIYSCKLAFRFASDQITKILIAYINLINASLRCSFVVKIVKSYMIAKYWPSIPSPSSYPNSIRCQWPDYL